MDEPIRDRDARERRLDPDRAHHFPLLEIAAALRREPEFEAEGRTGVILMKAGAFRALLEVARAGITLGPHVIHGPATVQVLEGAVEARLDGEARRAGPGELLVLPHEVRRELTVTEPAAFLIALALEGVARAGA